MRKPAFCICENKDADQLREADQRLFFATQIVQSIYFLNTKFQASSQMCGCRARFVWDLVGNPENRFSQNEAQIGMVRRLFYFDISFYMGWYGN